MKKLLFIMSLVMLSYSTVTAQANPASAKDISNLQFTNSQFYDSNGNFLKEKAKDAVMQLLAYHQYPVFEGMREKINVTDYGVGNFAKLGLSSITFVNNEKEHYMLMDIFILPGQMLGEHRHIAAAGNPAKMEGWLIKYGSSYIAGIGEDNTANFPQVVIPQEHWEGKTSSKHITEAKPGDFLNLLEKGSYHWQFGGKEGAILSEAANVHTPSGVKRPDPKMK
ncbi:cupin domain-containing protein [Flavobacterium algicola]|uniref:hypothetical protein n=1 Tax=Flavobacterium algicola TaxID=556529 RepID=UPI001EFE4C8E|nr:hypothetical protein [Flavobacterium algicola]MCG9791206.1 hypothetical protein [Flavobacterium algicola]